MKKALLSSLALGFALPMFANGITFAEVDKFDNSNVTYYSISETNICFKETRELESLENTNNNSGIKLATILIDAKPIDCSMEGITLIPVEEVSDQEPFLIDGHGKSIDYISSVTTKIKKGNYRQLRFEKSRLFTGRGIAYKPKNKTCTYLVIDLLDLERIDVNASFIQAPRVKTDQKPTDCQ